MIWKLIPKYIDDRYLSPSTLGKIKIYDIFTQNFSYLSAINTSQYVDLLACKYTTIGYPTLVTDFKDYNIIPHISGHCL
jgi:hypothetical protein